MTVYVDVIWLLNFFTDYLLLMLTGLFLKRKINKLRIAISSAVASMYVLLIFTHYASVFYHPVSKFICSMIIVYIAFRFKRFSYFFQNVAMFYFVTFMIGGGLIAVRFFLLTDSQLLNGIASMPFTGYGDPISWLFVAIGFPLLWFFTRERLTNMEYRSMTFEQMADVQIFIEEEIIQLKGLIDSGNLLTDPITKVPVMIMDISTVNKSLQLHELHESSLSMIDNEHPWYSRVRLIPFRSVGQEQQMLVALRPERIEIVHNDDKFIVKHCLVGLSKQRLSSDGDFECILHPKMLLHKHAS
ncbi:sigma-E processing peptidase SpoIIGA [Pueribacillus sp. YX66]|uniref:sigma-E processing peptidase SpoIIGA n=1 Tax=Pueribacillus sp. YX66 TaxID=3229242 RepID=UPI00358D7688